jgi:PAS domain S-box-containing protein
MSRTGTLRSRLRRGLLAFTTMAILLSSVSFLAYDHAAFRRDIFHRLDALAVLLAGSSAPALEFADRDVAEEILKSIAGQPQIRVAVLYKDGRPFASYSRPDSLPAEIPPSPESDGAGFRENHPAVWRHIQYKGAHLGSLFLQADLSDAWTRLRLNALITLAILAGVLLATGVFTGRFVRGITEPVAGLAETVRDVTSSKDYSLRAKQTGPAELELLIDGINDMLTQIQVRDGALQSARSDLESRVQERTAELRQLNDELSGEIRERRRAEGSLQENERTMRTLVDFAPDAILILDVSTGKFLDVNRNAERLFGLDRERLLGLNPIDLSPPTQPDGRRSSEASFEKLQQAVAGEIPSFEWTHRRSDGGLVDCEVHLVRLPVAGRTLIRGSIMDITKRKEMARLKDEFVSTVSHELRTPITSIQGSLGLLANGVLGHLPDRARPLVDVAYKNCQRLVLLLNDILDSEKIAAGRMSFSFEVCGLMDLVDQAIEANRAYAQQFGVALDLESRLEDARVEVDGDRILQVLTNLLSNAAKFSPKGGRVGVRVTRLEGRRIRVAVHNEGAGIAPEFRTRVFERFSQADSSDTRQKGGTGLGLSISKAIVEKHDGSLSFESEPGRGATFFMDLPAVDVDTAVLMHPVAEGPRILVCDDDAPVAEFLKTLLEQRDCRVELCASEGELRSRLGRKAVDLLILDVPDGRHLGLVEACRKNPATRRLPLVVLAGRAGLQEQDLEALARLNPSAVLDKPVDPARFLSAVEAALEEGRTRRPRVLHVDPDPAHRRMVSHALRETADIVCAGGLEEAKRLLREERIDLVVLNVDLPDGSGLQLMPELERPGRPRIPAVAFNGSSGGSTGAFLKILEGHDDLPAPVRRLVAGAEARAHKEGST